jgi:hypothetical protein
MEGGVDTCIDATARPTPKLDVSVIAGEEIGN